MRRRLLIIGDSITLGAADVRGNEIVARVETCYVDLLRAALQDFSITIDAEIQRTTVGVRNMLAATLQQHRPDMVLMMIGGSDADLDWKRFVLSNGERVRSRVPLETYERNLRDIAGAMLNFGATPILTDMNNHCFAMRAPYVSRLSGKDVVPMIERNGGQAESDRHLEEYRRAVGVVAEELGVPISRFGSALCDHEPRDVLSEDGAHPNARGHAIIANALLPILWKIALPLEARERSA